MEATVGALDPVVLAPERTNSSASARVAKTLGKRIRQRVVRRDLDGCIPDFGFNDSDYLSFGTGPVVVNSWDLTAADPVELLHVAL